MVLQVASNTQIHFVQQQQKNNEKICLEMPTTLGTVECIGY